MIDFIIGLVIGGFTGMCIMCAIVGGGDDGKK